MQFKEQLKCTKTTENNVSTVELIEIISYTVGLHEKYINSYIFPNKELFEYNKQVFQKEVFHFQIAKG